MLAADWGEIGGRRGVGGSDEVDVIPDGVGMGEAPQPREVRLQARGQLVAHRQQQPRDLWGRGWAGRGGATTGTGSSISTTPRTQKK